MANIRVGLYSNQFALWGGGIDFLNFINDGLIFGGDIDVEYLMANPLISELKPLNSRIVARAISARATIAGILSSQASPYDTSDATLAKRAKEAFGARTKNGVCFYSANHTSLLTLLKRLNIDIVLPVIDSLGANFPTPWIGYVWDFQHVEFPELFTSADIDKRNAIFAALSSDAPAILVNSKHVKSQLEKLYPQSRGKVFALPFSPLLEDDWLDNRYSQINKQYKLPKRYFIISNQFWQHKNHRLAFEALSLMKDKHIHLICTGKFEEPRNPGYLKDLKRFIKEHNLEQRVHILGYIPKLDQIEILKHAIALIQPTLHEGGPGGGSAYNSLALRIPTILSDIPINHEIQDPLVSFFKAESSRDLTRQMENIARIPKIRATNSDMKLAREKNLQKLHSALASGIDLACKNYKR